MASPSTNRAFRFDEQRDSLREDRLMLDGVNDIASMMTPAHGVVAKVKRDGDQVAISFAGDTADVCLDWQNTNRVQSVTPGGEVLYEKGCRKRGRVANQETATEVASKFAAGIAPGASVEIVFKFPLTVWKGK